MKMNMEFTCPHCSGEMIVELPIEEDMAYKLIHFPCPMCAKAIGISKESIEACKQEDDPVKHPVVSAISDEALGIILASKSLVADKTNTSLAVPCPHCQQQLCVDLAIPSNILEEVLRAAQFNAVFVCPNCEKPVAETIPVATIPEMLSSENPLDLTSEQLERLQTIFPHRFQKSGQKTSSPDSISYAEAIEFAQELKTSDVPSDNELLGEQ